MHRLTRTLAAAAIALAAFAAPAGAQEADEITLVTTSLRPMLPGEGGWVHTTWRGPEGATATDVRLTVKSNKDVDIVYPGVPARAFTSLHVDEDLDVLETDVAAFFIDVKDNVKPGKAVKLDFDAEYVVDGRSVRTSHSLVLVADDPGGTPYTLTTPAVSVVAGSVQWVHVHWRGNSGVDAFAVTSSGVSGTAVGYPEGRSDTSLWENAELAPGENDYVAILIDASDLAPGTYDLPLSVTSTVAPTQHTVSLQVV